MTPEKRRPLLVLAVVAVGWVLAFPVFYREFLGQYFYMPFLGMIAATVANTTPAAAGIVYFPILTRLNVAPITAVQFNLMIQAYGMGLGTFKWYLVNRRLFIFRVLPVCLLGAIIGVTTGILVFPVDNPELLTLIFNSVAFLFTQIIFFSILRRHRFPRLDVPLTPVNLLILFGFSLAGGVISGWIGFGIDTIFYFVLTMIFRINPAVAIVTSIALMAAVSVYGTILNLIWYSVPLALWYSTLPGVTLASLFLAAFLALKIGAKNVLLLFTMLLSADFLMSLWSQNGIPMSETVRYIVCYTLLIYIITVHVTIFRKSYEEIGESMGGFKPETPPEAVSATVR